MEQDLVTALNEELRTLPAFLEKPEGKCYTESISAATLIERVTKIPNNDNRLHLTVLHPYKSGTKLPFWCSTKPAAMYVAEGTIKFRFGRLKGATEETLTTGYIKKGSIIEITSPHCFHSLESIGHESYLVILAGPKWSDLTGEKGFPELLNHRKQTIINKFRSLLS